MRSDKDTCLLCEQNPACKIKSHIIPDSMVKRIRKIKKKVFKVDTSRQRTLSEQDVSKEQYILCEECEKYFGFLETHFGQKIKRFVDQGQIGVDFFELQMVETTGNVMDIGQTAYVCYKAQPLMTQLLIDSILFRIHIASEGTFAFTFFPPKKVKCLRDNLLAFKSKTYDEVLNKCIEYKGDTVFFTSYFLFGPKEMINTSKAIVYEFIEHTTDFLKILVGEYWIWIPTKPTKPNQSPFLNSGKNWVMIFRLTVQQYEIIYKNMFEFYAKIEAYNNRIKD